MIIDTQTQFSNEQAVTSTAISTNVIDLGATPTLRDLGTGETMDLVISVDEAATASGAATVTFSLESDSTADLATSATVHWSSAAIGKATLVAGYEVARIKIPAGSYERYLGLRYTVGTGPLTAGKFTASLVKDAQADAVYAAGFSIS